MGIYFVIVPVAGKAGLQVWLWAVSSRDGGGEQESSRVSPLTRAPVPSEDPPHPPTSLQASSEANDLPEASPPNTISLGLGLQQMVLGGARFSPLHRVASQLGPALMLASILGSTLGYRQLPAAVGLPAVDSRPRSMQGVQTASS